MGLALAVVGLVLLVAAWAGGGDKDEPVDRGGTPAEAVPAPAGIGGTTAPLGSTGLGEAVAPEHHGRRALRGFGEVDATITAADGTVCRVCLLAATSELQRRRGLMEVTDPTLGGYDGMLFVFPAASTGAFWMRNTPMALSIAYYDGRGALVSVADMAPCRDSRSCPTYPAAGAFRYALEVRKGGLGALGAGAGSTVRIIDWDCPLARRNR